MSTLVVLLIASIGGTLVVWHGTYGGPDWTGTARRTIWTLGVGAGRGVRRAGRFGVEAMALAANAEVSPALPTRDRLAVRALALARLALFLLVVLAATAGVASWAGFGLARIVEHTVHGLAHGLSG